MSRRSQLLGVFATIVLAVTACAGEDASTTTRATLVPSSPCPSGYPLELEVRAETVEEIEYLETITACTNDDETALWLANRSDAVWTLHTTSSVPVDQLTSSVRLGLFRESATSIHPDAVMAPNTEIVVDAYWPDVSWRIHPGLSAMWLIQDGLVDLVESYGQEQLTELAAGASLRRKALSTCSLAAYKVVNGVEEVLGEADPMENLLTALGVGASTTTCRAAWLEADKASLRSFGATPTWGDDVSRLADDARFLRQADDTLGWIHRAWRIVRLP